jgi:two-component system, chemotaxis family, CheB/CheR fusion protein
VPDDSGLTFVVVVHLDPSHESFMPELLARGTSLNVEAARDRQPMLPNCVYMIPPNRHLTIEQGLIRLREPVDRRGLRGTIDHFFRSLAADQHERSICIILSGTGTEGTLGARAVKAEGGMVMAQAPETAGQSGMPTSAIATGLVDFVLPPDAMPEALINFIRHPYVRSSAAPPSDEEKPADALATIVALLRGRTKHDLRGYKKGTLQRRVERRMGLQQIKTLPKYVEFLRVTPSECDLLFKDALIGVTGFFRDAEAYDQLAANVIAKLLHDDHQESPIRIWVPGCATGEEAYSLAILVSEEAARAHSPRRVQIFATDIDETALETARAGVYPESISLDVSPPRLQRYFTREEHRFRVAKNIRDMVVFAAQNLISDPPFSKLDLVSCRNVLIYLEPEVQRKLIALFHFALNAGGYLFLGAAEGPGEGDGLFAPVSKRWRIYMRRGPSKRPVVDIPFSPSETPRPERTAIKATSDPDLPTLAEHQLLQHFAPAAVVVNRAGHILHFAGEMNRYLKLPTGAPTLDLATLAREPVKPILRAALHDGIRQRRPASLETRFTTGRKSGGSLRITVSPLTGTRDDEGLSLVIFEEIAAPKKGSAERAAGKQQRDIVRRLESELKITKREQQSLVEQLERSNEELKASNEEVTSMNEELQSTNEELESSREELQSMNEELSTVNSQLQEKVQELTDLADDLSNLLAATDIATVFVDSQSRVARFTSAATRLLNLIPSDVGRPIEHLASNLVDFELTRETEVVLRTRMPIEKSVQAKDGRHYIVRVLPYMRDGKATEGVVVTLTDVTALRTSEQELRALNQNLEERIRERTRHLLLLHDVARTVSEASSWDEALHGVLRRICTAERWQVGYVYLPAEGISGDLLPAIAYVENDHFQRFHENTPWRFRRGEGVPGRVYQEGKLVRLDDQEALIRQHQARSALISELGLQSSVALPLSVGGETIAVLELFSTVRQAASGELTYLLTDVAAQISTVIDRERTMSQAAALVWREQQSLVHTLHDSLGQHLTGIGMLSSGLSKRLDGSNGDVAEIVSQIATQAQASVEQVRQLSKGLFPVEVDADGLAHALRRLAETTSRLGETRCTVEETEGVLVGDNRIATELYRIAQEAVTNALKHADAHTISVRLVAEAGTTILSIADDGRGGAAPEGQGMGMRIMRYRAQSIGASLTVESAAHAGTVVTCLLRDTPTHARVMSQLNEGEP